MNEIDLADFGFAGKKFLCEGDLDGEKKDGDKLLFLFAETDKGPASVAPNARNCVRLADDGVVGFVGVEYNPADQNDPGKDIRRDDLNFDVEMIVHLDMARLKEARFATTVRRLSNVPVDVIEDMGLWERAAVIEPIIKEELIGEKQRELLKKLKAEKPREEYVKLNQEARNQAELDPDVTKQLRDRFGDDPINYERDEAMVANLMARWTAVGTQKAAVLNAGKKHIDQIKDMLPPDVRYICVCHPAERDRIIKILMDYRNGKISKYGAMDALDLDGVWDLFDLLADYEIPPNLSRDYWQSDPSAKPAKDYFT